MSGLTWVQTVCKGNQQSLTPLAVEELRFTKTIIFFTFGFLIYLYILVSLMILVFLTAAASEPRNVLPILHKFHTIPLFLKTCVCYHDNSTEHMAGFTGFPC